MQEFFDWIGDNSWVAWAGGGLVLAIAELLNLDLVLLMLAMGAFAGAITAGAGAPVAAAIVVAVVVSAGMLYVVRPSMVRRLHRGVELRTGPAALIGNTAVVTSPVRATGGQIKLGGEVWSARAFDETLTIDVGTQVSVFEIDGATAVVHPLD